MDKTLQWSRSKPIHVRFIRGPQENVMKPFLRIAVLAVVSLICSAQTPISIRVETPAKSAPNVNAKKIATLHPGENFVVNKDV